MKLIWVPNIRRKAVFFSISLFSLYGRLCNIYHWSWCPWSPLCSSVPMLLPAPEMGGILSHHSRDTITGLADLKSCAPASWQKSRKTQKRASLFQKLKGTRHSQPPSFTQDGFSPNSGKRFRCWATLMVTSISYRHNKMLTQTGTQTPATCHGIWSAREEEVEEHYGQIKFLFHICTSNSCP